jgi:type IV secretory pathway VirB10-like protein
MKIKKAIDATTAVTVVTVAILAVGVAILALGLAACTANTGPTASPTATVTASAPASHAPAKGSSAPAPASDAPAKGSAAPAPASPARDTSAESLPDYQPATVISKSPTSATLSSPDPVAKIGAFYADVLAKDGWQVISSSAGAAHASFTAARGHQGASISVYPRSGGSGISISIYPR